MIGDTVVTTSLLITRALGAYTVWEPADPDRTEWTVRRGDIEICSFDSKRAAIRFALKLALEAMWRAKDAYNPESEFHRSHAAVLIHGRKQ